MQSAIGARIPENAFGVRCSRFSLAIACLLGFSLLSGVRQAEAQQWRITQVDLLRLDAKDLGTLQGLQDKALDLADKAADLTRQAAAEKKLTNALALEIQARSMNDQYRDALKKIDQQADAMAAAKMGKMVKEITDRCRTPFQARGYATSILARRALYLSSAPKLAAAMSKAATSLQSWASKRETQDRQKAKEAEKAAKELEDKKKKQQQQNQFR